MDLSQAWKEFIHWMPGGFADPKYGAQERDYKVERHCQLTGDVMRRLPVLLSSGHVGEAVRLLRSVSNGLNLLSRQEHHGLQLALGDEAAARLYIEAVLNHIATGGRDPTTFEHLAAAVLALPGDFAPPVATWPVATVYPYLARPDVCMFLKPAVTQKFARRVGFELRYRSEPNWATYARLLELAEGLLDQLRARGAKDLIDVQSFIWVVESYGRIPKPPARLAS